MSGEFLQINQYLVNALKCYNLWNDDIRSRIINADGSIQGIDEIPEHIRLRFRTAWEIPQRTLIDMAADRGAFIDQSQSLNLFVESPTIDVLSSMYMYAWKKGLKTTYYLRSRPATRIAKTTVSMSQMPQAIQDAMNDGVWPGSEKEILECLLENPEYCESCG
jgi:ribonucleoside-diphosphate reductase alpha chain